MLSVNNQSIGVPSFPIKELYIRAALEILIEGWNKLQEKRLVTSRLSENKITGFLNQEMIEVQRCKPSDIINWDILVGTQSDPNKPSQILQIDIKFRWNEYPNDYDRYLAVEAKKLYGTGASRAGKYVKEGVMDYINARYGRGHDYGIMMGYVVAPPIDNAIQRVQYTMNKYKTITKEYNPMTLNQTLCLHQFTFHSAHLQNGTQTPITLVHVFLRLFNN